jgi:hypothetical protein
MDKIKNCFTVICFFLSIGCRVQKDELINNLFKFYNNPSTNSVVQIADKYSTLPIYVNVNEYEVNLDKLKKWNGGSEYRLKGLSKFCDSLEHFNHRSMDVKNVFNEIKKTFPKNIVLYSPQELEKAKPIIEGITISIYKLLKFDNFSICIIRSNVIKMNLYSTDIIVFDKKGKIIRTFSDQFFI